MLDPYPYDPHDGREVGDVIAGKRVQRGGAFAHPPEIARCAYRAGEDPRAFGSNVGFRVVLLER
jgi:formylglycine-generating enzyme required for sulfatase activity